MSVPKTVSVVVTAALLAAAGSAVPAQAAYELGTIQPGARSVVADTTAIGTCTLGFVYDGTGAQAGKVYIGTAAHCVTHVGQAVSLLETPATPFGDVAAIGSLAAPATDWALIEVRPAFFARVSAGVKNHPSFPTGVAVPTETAVGDPVLLNDVVVIPKPWVPLVFDDTETYRVGGTLSSPPSVVPDDSGGPLVHVPTGHALGTVSQGIDCSLPALVCKEYAGPTVQGTISKAAAAGLAVTLRTV